MASRQMPRDFVKLTIGLDGPITSDSVAACTGAQLGPGTFDLAPGLGDALKGLVDIECCATYGKSKPYRLIITIKAKVIAKRSPEELTSQIEKLVANHRL